MIVSVLAAILMGFAELYRGATAGLPRIIEKAILGALALLALVGLPEFSDMMRDWRFAMAYLLLFAAACSVSWGAVIGGALNHQPTAQFQSQPRDRGDWYLVGWFRTSPMRGLLARSIVWGVLASAALFAFGYTGAGLAMLAVYSVAMPAAVCFLHAIDGSSFDLAIGRMCQSLVGKSHAWPRHEVYRGWIAGIMLLSASQFIG